MQIAMSGKSIEIINTDAEGRLVLADGLHYARAAGRTHLIDAATLTGACRGGARLWSTPASSPTTTTSTSAFSNANDEAGEKMWRLPLDDEYREQIKSDIADIMNTGGRWGGAITAAMFLKEFVERYAVDSSRHRRHGLDGRPEAVDRQRAVGHCGAQRWWSS